MIVNCFLKIRIKGFIFW